MSNQRLRIATWNIASNRDIDAIAAKVAQLDVDICAVQEVSIDPAVDLPAMFGPGPGSASGHHWYFTPALVPEEWGGGKFAYFGLAMLSRIPLHRIAAFQLGPHNTGSVANAENEPRILQIGALQLEQPIIFGNTHLASTSDWSSSDVRRSQAAKIAGIIKPLVARGPVILCGDFNAESSSSDFEAIREALPCFYAGKEATYVGEPGWPPIDFFCSSAALDVTVTVCPADGLSDHNLVVATLDGIGNSA